MQGPNFIILHVPSVTEATTFYEDKLGFQVETRGEQLIQYKSSDGAATLALSAGEPSQADSTELWWFVENADATHNELASKGVQIASPPKDEPFGRAFSIKDPVGNTLYLLQLHAA